MRYDIVERGTIYLGAFFYMPVPGTKPKAFKKGGVGDVPYCRKQLSDTSRYTGADVRRLTASRGISRKRRLPVKDAQYRALWGESI
jgi:hypothetical protein